MTTCRSGAGQPYVGAGRSLFFRRAAGWRKTLRAADAAPAAQRLAGKSSRPHESVPENATHWSVGPGRDDGHQPVDGACVWKANGLKPHLTPPSSWQDPHVREVQDLVGCPESSRAPSCFVDERARFRPSTDAAEFADLSGPLWTLTHELQTHGTTNCSGPSDGDGRLIGE